MLNNRLLSLTSFRYPHSLHPCQLHSQIRSGSKFSWAWIARKNRDKLALRVAPHKKTVADQSDSSVALSDEQRGVLKMVMTGESVFFTGSAGTGKTVLLREIIRGLRDKGKIVQVTASTGIAAVNVGGTTLHAFAGVGVGNLGTHMLVKRARASKKTAARWRKTDVLVIDEISMVDATWFDALDKIGRSIRKSPGSPFGGLQLVICGDFFQLPPVPKRIYGEKQEVSYAFEAASWGEAVPNTVRLTQVFRQKDLRLINLLNDMRQGIVSAESEALLNGLSRDLEYEDGIQPTELYSLRARAEAANQKHMDELSGKPEDFDAVDYPGIDAEGSPTSEEAMTALLDKIIPPKLKLRVHAQVMCVKNLPGTSIVNGSIGRVVDFMTLKQAIKAGHQIYKIQTKEGALDLHLSKHKRKTWPLVQFDKNHFVLMTAVLFEPENETGRIAAYREQVPLMLAWALTVHKAQGQTLSRVKIDLGKTFAPGQVYVALSRCTSLDGLQVLNFTPRAVLADKDVLEWSENLSVLDEE